MNRELLLIASKGLYDQYILPKLAAKTLFFSNIKQEILDLFRDMNTGAADICKKVVWNIVKSYEQTLTAKDNKYIKTLNFLIF